jgi:hypothetical protein
LGLWGSAVVRPHVALIFCVGLALAAPFGLFRVRTHDHSARRGRLGGAVLLIGLVLASSTLIGITKRFFELDSLNTQAAQHQLDETARRSEIGGSQFAAYSPTNPVGFVLSGVTVLFRPFPFEVGNAAGILTGIEGIALLFVCVVSVRRLVRLPAEFFRRPYVACAVAYGFAFVYAFSSIGNFGILARQRVQLLPILFVILCVQRRDELKADTSETLALQPALERQR